MRLAYLAVRSGAVNTAMALGVEKFTDVIGGASEAMLAHMLDADYEAAEGWPRSDWQRFYLNVTCLSMRSIAMPWQASGNRP